jgi:hypothetical protein
MSIFGTHVDAAYVEDDVKSHLETWLPTYLAQIAQDLGLPRNTWFRQDGTVVGSWTFSTEFTVEQATALPAILILNSGLAGPPVMEGDGTYRATWVIGIGGLVQAGGDNPVLNTSRLAKRFASAVKLSMLQAAWDSPYLEGISWDDEGYDDASTGERSLGSFRLVFGIEYSNVLNANLGTGNPIPVPDPTPGNSYPDWGTIPDVDHVHVDIQKEPLNE